MKELEGKHETELKAFDDHKAKEEMKLQAFRKELACGTPFSNSGTVAPKTGKIKVRSDDMHRKKRVFKREPFQVWRAKQMQALDTAVSVFLCVWQGILLNTADEEARRSVSKQTCCSSRIIPEIKSPPTVRKRRSVCFVDHRNEMA
jgi:hypothetical protein